MSHLKALLHHIVDNEQTEQSLAAQNDVVTDWNITQQLYGTESPGWHNATSSGELHQQPVI